MALGAFGRLWRDRLSAAAALVLVLVVVASSLLQTGLSTRLSQVLDQHWRGAYDLLVRPRSGDLDTSSTQGFVEGNFVGLTGQGGISLKQLATIRAIPAVDLAAPIGLVGEITDGQQSPVLTIPDAPAKGIEVLPKAPTLYRITFSISLTDSSGTRVVEAYQANAVLRQSDPDHPNESTMNTDGAMSGGGIPGQGMTLSVGSIPSFSSPVIAVDPAAEKKLLGANGSFLAPLIEVPEGPRTATALENSPWLRSLPRRYEAPVSFVEIAPDTGQGVAPVIPLLVNDTPPAAMTLAVTVQHSTKRIPSMPKSVSEVAAIAKGATFSPVGRSSKDLSRALVPFAPANLEVPWPGTKRIPEEEMDLSGALGFPELVGRPAYRVIAGPADSSGTPSFRVQPQGVVAVDGTGFDPKSGISGVQSYRTATMIEDAAVNPAQPLPLPIASFSLKNLDFGTTDVSYVPYGAYDPATTTLIADPAGTPTAHRPIVANPSGLDFISPAPGAITDLAGAQSLRGKTPIDAVRVRVGGISAYTPATQQKIIRVAKRIQAMGLAVTVVAGSSPQPVDVYVPQYLINATGHPTGDLGWVRQDWTTLGATVTVQNALTTLSVTLLLLALAVATILLIATALAGGPSRAEQARVLTVLGWTRRRILRWQLAPQMVLAVLVCVVAILAVALTGGRAVTLWPAMLAVVVALGGLAVVGATGIRRTGRPARSSARRRDGARPRPPRATALMGTPLQLAVRQAGTRPGGALARTVSWAAIGAAACGVVVALMQARGRVGATRLAGLAVDRTAAADLALGAVAVLAGIVMAVLARRVERRHRIRQRATLRLAGWTRRDARRLAWASTLTAGIPAVLVAAGLGLVIALVVGGHHWFAPGVAAAVTGAIVVAVLAADAGRADR